MSSSHPTKVPTGQELPWGCCPLSGGHLAATLTLPTARIPSPPGCPAGLGGAITRDGVSRATVLLEVVTLLGPHPVPVAQIPSHSRVWWVQEAELGPLWHREPGCKEITTLRALGFVLLLFFKPSFPFQPGCMCLLPSSSMLQL